ncbi:hypothetical protein ACOMHN_005636 [Nucella lapillus]
MAKGEKPQCAVKGGQTVQVRNPPPQSPEQMTPLPGQPVADETCCPGQLTPGVDRMEQELPGAVLLQHAHRCRCLETEGGDKACNSLYCRAIRNVLSHMSTCTKGGTCDVAHCVSSIQIINHWKTCTRGKDCPVCLPLRPASSQIKFRFVYEPVVGSEPLHPTTRRRKATVKGEESRTPPPQTRKRPLSGHTSDGPSLSARCSSTSQERLDGPAILQSKKQGGGQAPTTTRRSGVWSLPPPPPMGLKNDALMAKGERPRRTVKRRLIDKVRNPPPLSPEQMTTPLGQPEADETCPGQLTSKTKKIELFRHQLLLLLHAKRCEDRGEAGGEACGLGYCRTMRNVLAHLAVCTSEKACDVPHCVSSKQILRHWKCCTLQRKCPMCGPVTSAQQAAW